MAGKTLEWITIKIRKDMKIPFTLDAWLKDKSQKVETRDGRPVKIISFEMTDTNDCPIAAQFRLCAGTPVVYLFDKEGNYKGEGNSDYDLSLITPEPELSEFEKACMRLYNEGSDDGLSGDKLSNESLKESASELLELARKELEGDLKEKVIHDYWKQASDQCAQAREEGRKEALKDLPRWRKWGNGAAGNSDGHPIALVSGAGGIRFVSVLGITGEKYIMLDDLKKLPGFKED